MSTLTTIIADIQQLRKQRATDDVVTLTTLLSAIQLKHKSHGDPSTVKSDEICMEQVKSFIKSLNESIATMAHDRSRVAALERQRALVERYLPVQLTEDELERIVEEFVDAGHAAIGSIMALLKQHYFARYDGSTAMQVVKRVTAERSTAK